MISKNLRNKVAKDPLKKVRKATVAIGTLSHVPSLPDNQLYYDGSDSGFNVQATGFIYACTPLEFAEGKSDPDSKTGTVRYWAQLWIVTCKHCVSTSKVVAVRLDTKSSGTRVYRIHSDKWILHPTEDIAVTPLSLTSGTTNLFEEERASIVELDLESINRGQTASKSEIARMGFYESTPVSMIGFPIGMIEGGKKNYPAVRSGTIAQIEGCLDADPEHTEFLIDGSIFGGNSGGPIVVPKGTWTAESVSRLSDTVLIGMVSGSSYAPVKIENESPSEVWQNTDLVHAVTVDSINAVIHDYYLEKNRKH